MLVSRHGHRFLRGGIVGDRKGRCGMWRWERSWRECRLKLGWNCRWPEGNV